MPLYLLDTDHMSLLRRGGAAVLRLESRLNEIPDEDVVTCVVVFEEQMRGWMSQVALARTGARLVRPYDSLATTLEIYCSMTVLPFDGAAASRFDILKSKHPRLGTQDLKIAAIALANDATVLTRNVRDFGAVGGLRVEDWSS